MNSRVYGDHFGLSESAFSVTHNPRYLYMSERHYIALAQLLYGVVGSGCFVLLTGEVGTGKTTICRAMLEQMPENVEVALLHHPPQSGRELLLAITDELGLFINHRDESFHDLSYVISRRLLENHAHGRKTVLIIDEAQNLQPEVLEQVRLLCNLEKDTEKLIHVFLVGLPALRELLMRPSLAHVAQRITARFHLEPLSAEETRRYVNHRLGVAGCPESLFTHDALNQLHRESGGVPRVINMLCERALLAAFSHNLKQVTRHHVRHAAREWRGITPHPWYWLSGWRYLLSLSAICALLITTVLLDYRLEPSPPFAAAAAVAHDTMPAVVARPVDMIKQTGRVTALTPLLTEPAGSSVQLIGPDSSPEAIRWLKAQLDLIDGQVTNDNSPQYDEQLRRRVMALQYQNGLIADGIVGPRTLGCIVTRINTVAEKPITNRRPQT